MWKALQELCAEKVLRLPYDDVMDLDSYVLEGAYDLVAKRFEDDVADVIKEKGGLPSPLLTEEECKDAHSLVRVMTLVRNKLDPDIATRAGLSFLAAVLAE